MLSSRFIKISDDGSAPRRILVLISGLGAGVETWSRALHAAENSAWLAGHILELVQGVD